MGLAAAQVIETGRIVALLGGTRAFRTVPESQLGVHAFIQAGFPGKVLTQLVANVPLIADPVMIEKALGISQRTLQRRKVDEDKRLSVEQSSRTWKFAEIVTKATEVFGAQDEAERWLDSPVMALDGQCPIDLLSTSVGTELVEQLLDRMDYGVYA